MTGTEPTGVIVDELAAQGEEMNDAFVDAVTDAAYAIYRAVAADIAISMPRLQFVPGPRQPITAPMFGLERLVEEWNAANPIGTKVVVDIERGRREAKTVSLAWIVSSRGVGIYLKGSRGYHNLDYVRRLEDPNG